MRSLCFWKATRFVPIVTVLSITACNVRSPSQQINQELETVGSWAATAHLVGESWLRQDVPVVYAKQTLEKTQNELKKELETINHIESSSSRSSIQTQIQQIQSTIADLGTEINQQDRQAVTHSLQELSNQEKALQSFSESLGGA